MQVIKIKSLYVLTKRERIFLSFRLRSEHTSRLEQTQFFFLNLQCFLLENHSKTGTLVNERSLFVNWTFIARVIEIFFLKLVKSIFALNTSIWQFQETKNVVDLLEISIHSFGFLAF